MQKLIPLKDTLTVILLGYAAELSKIKPNGDEDLEYRQSLKTELENRGVKPNYGVYQNLLTGPTD